MNSLNEPYTSLTIRVWCRCIFTNEQAWHRHIIMHAHAQSALSVASSGIYRIGGFRQDATHHEIESLLALSV